MRLEKVIKKESGYSYKITVEVYVPNSVFERDREVSYSFVIEQRAKGAKKWLKYVNTEITKEDINKAYYELYDKLKPNYIF